MSLNIYEWKRWRISILKNCIILRGHPESTRFSRRRGSDPKPKASQQKASQILACLCLLKLEKVTIFNIYPSLPLAINFCLRKSRLRNGQFPSSSSSSSSSSSERSFFQLFDFLQYSGIDETNFNVKLISVHEINFSTSI